MTTATKTLRATLIAAVELSKTDINVADRLYTLLSETSDRNDQTQIKLAIRHAEKNAAAL